MGRRYLVFLCAQASLYSAFLTLDLLQVGSGWSTALKYGSILLCVLLSCGGSQDPDRRLVRAALGVTLLADLFLLVLGRWYLAGVGAFCVVQALYFVRLRRLRGGRVWPRLLLRLALSGAVLLVAGRFSALEPLTALSVFYFTQLAANALESLFLGRRYAAFSAGLVLFVCCDLCVGLQNLSAFLPVSGHGGLFAFARVGMWLFYLPSQVLITLSAGKK